MYKKRGFIFLETIIVLIVTVISMLGLFFTYSFLIKNLNQGRHYDNINDVYKLNIFYKLMKEKGFPSDELLKITNSNCENYFDNNCQLLMEKLGFDYFIYTKKDLDNILSNPTNLLNTDINYLKILEHNRSYLIGVYQIDNEYYYVSMEAGEL